MTEPLNLWKDDFLIPAALNWKKATSLGFAALGVVYTLLFCWCIIATTYGDHIALNAHIGTSKNASIGKMQQTPTQPDCIKH